MLFLSKEKRDDNSTKGFKREDAGIQLPFNLFKQQKTEDFERGFETSILNVTLNIFLPGYLYDEEYGRK